MSTLVWPGPALARGTACLFMRCTLLHPHRQPLTQTQPCHSLRWLCTACMQRLAQSCPPIHCPDLTAPHAQTNENISPGVVLTVAKELRKLTNEPLDGIKVVLNEEDVTDVTAGLEGPGQPCPKSQLRRACQLCGHVLSIACASRTWLSVSQSHRSGYAL